MIGVVDYGMGNLGSVTNAFRHLGLPATVLPSPDQLGACDRILLPGVGSFAHAMRNLNQGGWTEALRDAAAAGKPLLGVCLGMQLLFDEGLEHGPSAGLGLIPGRVVPLVPASPCRVPHVGWNDLTYARPHPLLKGLRAHVDMYFVHSFHCCPVDAQDILATSDHGGAFVAVVARGNVAGTQFHPEKSQDAGLKLLENFAAWEPAC